VHLGVVAPTGGAGQPPFVIPEDVEEDVHDDSVRRVGSEVPRESP
jgi:hypothetical protein